MPNISRTLALAAQILADSGVAEPRREAASLLSFALGKDRTFLIAHPDDEIEAEGLKAFNELLSRRAAREPLQYIRGHQEFFGLDFEVTPDVLIPRPETEILVEDALEILKPLLLPRICEIGIGTGCIAISLLYHLTNAFAVGLEISEAAIGIARRNSRKHGVAERFDIRRSDVFSALSDERFDVIVSNPPYVPVDDMESLQAEVRDFEPRTALTDGGDGLSIIRRIIAGSPKHLVAGGALLIEIGFDQASAVREMFEPELWRSVDFLPDLQGIPRIARADLA